MKVILSFIFVISLLSIKAEPDPNFYIFLCFGQSNMEGHGPVEDIDRHCDPRFKVMAAIDMPLAHRQASKWYTATPPLCRDYCYLSPADYFGRTLVEKLPKEIDVGVINVSIGGASIDLFIEEKVEKYMEKQPDWMKRAVAKYDNNPFRALMNRAKEAQQKGVIKGILLHQGENDFMSPTWQERVKLVYTRMLKELGLNQNEVPLLAGEMCRTEMGGGAGKMNIYVDSLPDVIDNCHVISSENLPPYDNLHFTSQSYRIFGRRYGEKMYELLTKQQKNNRKFSKFKNIFDLKKKVKY